MTDELKRLALAQTAATAARSVAGVVRLQPGLVGLLKQFATQAWERTTGRPVPDVAGIDVDLRADGLLLINARIVTAVTHNATEVGHAVRTAITKEVESTTGSVPEVRVRIVEIALEPQHG
ncbi:hypothetical protein ACWEOO_34840 [Kribbella sp. NPDC004138]